MTTDDIRRHPAYKHGFEGHRRYKNSGEDHPLGYHEKYGLNIAKEFSSTLLIPGTSFSPYDIWMSGAHAGMKNHSTGYSLGGEGNPEPIYDYEPIQVQLDLFSN